MASPKKQVLSDVKINMAEIGKDIEKARALLDKGEIVGIPTETVYGLAANALNTAAVTKIFTTKNRPQFDPLIIHTHDVNKISSWVKHIPDQAIALADKFWPGPLTLLLDKSDQIHDLVTSGLPRVAIRIPDHPMTLALLAQLDYPLAAPSANPFGYVSPTQPTHVNDQLGDKIKYILDGGPCKIGIESTIIGFEKGTPVIYRLGGIPIAPVKDIIGDIKINTHSESNPVAPGKLKSHYAPNNQMIIGDIPTLLKDYSGKSVAVLSFQKNYEGIAPNNQKVLSPEGSVETAAKHLFSSIRELDLLNTDFILTEFVPDHGIGRAINDRLRRAAAK